MALRASAPTIVGRASELARFEAALVRAGRGVATVLLVGGDAGIGKSTLVAGAADRFGASLHLARCLPLGGDAIPLAPLADLLRGVRRSADDLDPDLLAPLLRWLSPTDPTAPDLGPGGLFGPVLELLAALGRRGPAIIAVEDLHWADSETWSLFDFLARNLSDEGVLLVGTYRTDEVQRLPILRRRVAELARLDAVETMAVGGLDREAVAARVDELLGRPASPALVDEIVDRGEGNPFFTEQLVAAHAAGDRLPAALVDLVAAELSGVDEPTRQVLGAVATIGRDTSHELLARVTDVAGDSLEAALRSAIDAQLLVVDPDTDRYRFRHPLIGEVTYRELLPPQRARLHGRVASALREQAANALSRADRAGELAFHLDRAGEHEAAFTASLAAADAAADLAPAAALAHLQRALDLWPEGVDERQRVRRLWEAAELANAVIGAGRAAEMARDAFTAGPPAQGEAWGHERLARYLWSAGALEESHREYDRAAAAVTGPDDPGALGVWAGLAQAEVMAARADEAAGWADRVVAAVAGGRADPSAWSMAQRVLGLVASDRGDAPTAVRLCHDAFAAAPNAQARGIAVLYWCVALLDAGRNQEALDVAGDAVVVGHRNGIDPMFGGYMDALAAEALLRLGRGNDAEHLLARHRDDTILPVGILRVARVEALLAARRGEGDAARSWLSRAEAQPTDGWHRLLLELAAAEVHLTLGDWAAAAAAASRGAAAAPEGARLWRARFAHLATDAAVELALDARAAGDAVDGQKVADRCGALLAPLELPVDDGAPDVHAHLRHARASLTRLAGAEPDAWSSAAAAWERLGDAWWRAVARLREGEAAAASTTGAARAADALRDASAAATAMGATALAAEIEAVARRGRLTLDAPVPVDLGPSALQRLGLTPREAEVLALVSSGLTNRQIGEQLFVSEKTASVHVSNILRKMGATSRVDAAAMAQRLPAG